MKNKTLLLIIFTIGNLLLLTAFAGKGIGVINKLGINPNTGAPNVMCFNKSQSNGPMQEYGVDLKPGQVNLIFQGGKAAYNMQYGPNIPCTNALPGQWLGAGNNGNTFTFVAPGLNVMFQQVGIEQCTNIAKQITACYQAVWK